MAINKPVIGSQGWGATLNATLDELDAEKLDVTDRTVTVASAGIIARDAFLFPFSADAPWNTPVGAGATFAADGAATTVEYLAGSATINSNNGFGIPVTLATANDPLTTVTDSQARSFTFRLPSDSPIATGTDRHMTVVDGTNVFDYIGTARDAAGVISAEFSQRNSLLGKGIAGGTRASAFPAMAGLIRLHEIDTLDVQHALVIALTNSMLKSGFVWPAAQQDTDGAATYAGSTPQGSLLAIPPTVNVESMVLSPEGLALARALQRYGAYVGDRSANVAIYAEPTVERERAAAFSRMRDDWSNVLRPLLRMVTNHSEATPAGPGERTIPVLFRPVPTATFTRADADKTLEILLPPGGLSVLAGTPTLGSVGGSRYSALLFSPTAFGMAGIPWRMSADWSNINIDLLWTNAGAGVGGVRWAVVLENADDGGSLTVTDQDVSLTVTAPGQDVLRVTRFFTGKGVPAARLQSIRVLRDAENAADTLPNDAAVVGIRITRAQ